ncbi:MAG: hypothetical protein HQL32_08915 [Planctomycetes bacterium]|nr:hypothetical protein [Planctomycetota bacterium]
MAIVTMKQMLEAAKRLDEETNTPEKAKKHLQKIGYLDSEGKPVRLITSPQM